MTIIPHSFKGKNIPQLSKDSTFSGVLIPKSYCNATEMCKANGKRWVKYLEFSKTKPFLEALSEVSPSKGLTYIITISEGANETRGTWVSLPVAMNLAQWCSPEFAAWASIVLSEIVSGNYEALTKDAEEAEQRLKESWQKIRNAGKATRRTLTDAIKEWYERNPNGSTRPVGAMIAQTTNITYQRLWGMDALQLEAHLGCGRHDSRDHLSEPDIALLDRAEANVAEFIDDDNVKPVNAASTAQIRRAKNPPQHK